MQEHNYAPKATMNFQNTITTRLSQLNEVTDSDWIGLNQSSPKPFNQEGTIGFAINYSMVSIFHRCNMLRHKLLHRNPRTMSLKMIIGVFGSQEQQHTRS